MKIDLMGLKVNTETKKQILSLLEDRFKSGQKTFIVTPYSEFFYYQAINFKFRQALAEADLELPDGISVLWLAYFLSIPFTVKNYYAKIFQAFWQMVYTGAQILLAPAKIRKVIPEKISGSDFFWDLCALADKTSAKIFLLGGWNDTPEIVAKKISEKYSQIKIAGWSNASPDSPGLAEKINSSGAEILFVAYGPVKQELWIADNLVKLNNVKIAIGVGGTFDYIAGKRNPPPQFVRNMGLEWLYRLFTQARFKRIWIAIFVFIRGAIRHKVFSSMPFRRNVAGVIINSENQILVGNSRGGTERGVLNRNEEHWQFPQGGVDRGETDEQAVLREMREETGLTNLQILGKAKQTHSYLWLHMLRPLFANRLKNKGQIQTIFFLKYSGDASELQIDHHEFGELKWVPAAELINVIHPVRRQMLDLVLEEVNQYV